MGTWPHSSRSQWLRLRRAPQEPHRHQTDLLPAGSLSHRETDVAWKQSGPSSGHHLPGAPRSSSATSHLLGLPAPALRLSAGIPLRGAHTGHSVPLQNPQMTAHTFFCFDGRTSTTAMGGISREFT